MNTDFEQAAQNLCREYISKAQDCLGNQDLDGARAYLDKAWGKADERLRQDIADLRIQIENRRGEIVRDLESQIQAALQAEPFVEEAVQSLIVRLEGLIPEDGRISVWKDRARERAKSWKQAQEIGRLKGEVEKWLESARRRRSRGDSPSFIEGDYGEALRIAESALANYPEAWELDELVRQVRSERATIVALLGSLTTVGATGHYREVIESLRAKDPTEEVEVYDLEGHFLKRLPAKEAVEEYKKQAAQWIIARTPVKIEDARRALSADHSPEGAFRIVEEFLLNTSGLMPDPEKAAIEKLLREEIEPARQRRQEASRLLIEAESMADVTRAWDTLRAARQQDPHTPDLGRVETTLRTRLQARVKQGLEDARDLLEKRLLSEARQRVQEVLKEARLDQAPEIVALQKQLGELDARIQVVQKQVEDVRGTVADIRRLLDKGTQEASEEARRKFEALQDRLGPAANEYPEIQAIAPRLTASLDLARFLASVDDLLKGNDDRALQETWQELSNIRSRYPDRRDILDRYENRLKARQAFLQAAREVEAGSLLEAERLLKIATLGDDRPQAQEWLRKIEEGRKRDAEACQALQQVRPFLTTRPEEAYRILVNWRQDPWILSRDEVKEAWRQMAIAWQPKVEEELETLLQAPVGSLDVNRIRFLVEEVLVRLGHPRTQAWRQRALPRCYRDLALAFEEQENWTEAVKWWGNAVQEASSEEKTQYLEQQENAQLREELHKLDPTDSSDAMRDRLKGLEKKYSQSVEVKGRLARLYQARGEEENALRYAEWGLALIERSKRGGEHRSALEKVREWAQKVKKAAGQKQEIESLLALDRGVEDFTQAVTKAHQLLTDFPELKADLEIWWRECKSKAIQGLSQEMENLELQQETLFGQIEIASRILCLDKNHHKARDKLAQFDVSLEKLRDDAKRLETNKAGRDFGGDPARALDEHLKRAIQLRDQARQARDVLKRLGSYLGDRRPDEVSTLIHDLESLVDNLQKFQAALSRARGGLTAAKGSGDWSVVEAALREIKNLGYDEHQSTEQLKQEYNRTKERRQNLEKLAGQIADLWKQDRFREMVAALNRMASPEEGDPNGEYNIGPGLSLQDEEGRTLARGIKGCRELVEARQNQVDTMEGWLQRLRSWANWPQIERQIEQLLNRGGFDEAFRLYQTTAGSPGDAAAWLIRPDANPSSMLDGITLEQASAYLKQHPIPREKLASKRAKAVLNEAEEKLKEVTAWLEAAHRRGRDIQNRREEWDKAWEELNRAQKALNRLTRGGPPVIRPIRQWLHRQEIKDLKERRTSAIEGCKRVCPEHPLLGQFPS